VADVYYFHIGEYQAKDEPPEDPSPWRSWLNRKTDKAIKIIHGIAFYR